MTSTRSVTVYGAYGHTGRFVVAELRRRGWTPIPAARDRARLEAIDSGSEPRVASVDDPASIDAAIRGSRAVINCAGSFLDTAVPEQAAMLNVFERFATAASTAICRRSRSFRKSDVRMIRISETSGRAQSLPRSSSPDSTSVVTVRLRNPLANLEGLTPERDAVADSQGAAAQHFRIERKRAVESTPDIAKDFRIPGEGQDQPSSSGTTGGAAMAQRGLTSPCRSRGV